MKKKLIIGLLVVSCLVLFASCSNNTKADNKIPSWLANKTWEGELIMTGTVGGQSHSDKQTISLTFDENGVKMDGAPDGMKVSYLSNGDKCEIKMSYEGVISEKVSGKLSSTINLTRVADNECKVDGNETVTIDGVSLTATITGTLKAK